MSMRIRPVVDGVDERHREGTEPVEGTLAEHEARLSSRRTFVRSLGLGAAAVGAVAVGGVALAGGASAQDAGGDAPELSQGDIQLLAFHQSLELAVVEAYVAAVDTRLLDPTATEMARRFERHHRDHAQTMGALLPEGQVVTTPNATLLTELTAAIDGASTVQDIQRAMYVVEQSLAATYLRSIGLAESWLVAGPMASIMPIDAEQAVALGLAIGEPKAALVGPVATTERAYDPARYPVS